MKSNEPNSMHGVSRTSGSTFRSAVIGLVIALLASAHAKQLREQQTMESGWCGPGTCNPLDSCKACTGPSGDTGCWGSCSWCAASETCNGYHQRGECAGGMQFVLVADGGDNTEKCQEKEEHYQTNKPCPADQKDPNEKFDGYAWEAEAGGIGEKDKADCILRAVAGQCKEGEPIMELCSMACVIYSKDNGGRECKLPVADTEIERNGRSLAHDLQVEGKLKLEDIIFVTETGLAHTAIRIGEGRGAEISHAMLVSQITPRIMVLEAVLNVEANHPTGIREVALEYAFKHVRLYEVMRKKTACKLPYKDGHATHPNPEEVSSISERFGRSKEESAIEWARDLINCGAIVTVNEEGEEKEENWNPRAVDYAVWDSRWSVGPTRSRVADYNDADKNMPEELYCSEFVNYILYEGGCAWHSATNLKMDPWETFKQLTWSYNYKSVNYGAIPDGGQHAKMRAYTLDKEEKVDNEEICAKHNGNKLDCKAVEALLPSTDWNEEAACRYAEEKCEPNE